MMLPSRRLPVLFTLISCISWKNSLCEQQQVPVTINTYGSCNGDSSLEQRVKALESMILQQSQMMHDLESEPNTLNGPSLRDCSDVFKAGNRSQGVYTIKPYGSKPFLVYCQFDNEGLWTVLQRRRDGYVDFERNWVEYKHGFGILDADMWLGNDKIHAVTTQRQYTLRIDITDWDGVTHYASYRFFEIGDETSFYRLHYQNYSGTAGDSLGEYHRNKKFSTFDRDNDNKLSEHCAAIHHGGWWYNECDLANLNGIYHHSPELKSPTDSGIEWDKWRPKYSFKSVTMKIKPTFPN